MKSINKQFDFRKLLPFVIGIFAFLLIYGVTPLDVTNDHWIMAGYDETDIIQHYNGWMAFRSSDWSFPLGYTSGIAAADGTYITFVDALPWVSIFFKIFRNFLPETFQFFGLYILLCYILQSVASYKLVYYKCKNSVYSLVASVFFVFAPIFMERAFRHTALGSQWLIIFAIYFFMKHRDSYDIKNYIYYLILMVLAIGLHPYFLPMVGVFALLCVIEDFRRKKFISAAYLAGILAVTYIAGLCIGALGTIPSLYRYGYGFYSMNLNAPINPVSMGGYSWSAFMKEHIQRYGQIDGFNYLGAGILCAILSAAIFTMIRSDLKTVLGVIRRNIFVIILMAICTAFAVSNIVTVNYTVLFSYELPAFLTKICGIFRASSRIFYPVYYMIYFTAIYVIWRTLSKHDARKVCLVLGLLCLVQIADLERCIIQKHQDMNANASYVSILDSDEVNGIMAGRSALLSDTLDTNNRYPAAVAIKNGLDIYYSIANSGSYDATVYQNEQLTAHIRETGDIGDYVVVTTDIDILNEYLAYDNITYVSYEDMYFIAGK